MRTLIGLTLSLLLCSQSARADDTLAVPLNGQELNQWCWNGCSTMVLEWYGHAGNTQAAIAAWAVAGLNIPNSLDLNGVEVNIPGTGKITKYGCKQVLKQFGPVQSSFLGRALTKAEVEDEMDGGRPAILGVF